MPKPKKNGEKISLYLDKETVNRIRAYAEEKGQTLTVAIERALKSYLDKEESSQNNK